MKIGFISDIHFDMNNKEVATFLSDIVNVIKKLKLDKVIIAGDISGEAELTMNVIDEIEYRTQKNIYFVPGNHDIWSNTNSWDEYNMLKEHPNCISEKIINLNDDTVLVGDLFWYDYSYNNGFQDYRIKKKKYRQVTWNDLKWAKWGMTDKEVSDYFINKMDKTLSSVQDKKIIFVSHTVPFRKMVLYTGEATFDFFNCYLGSSKIGDLILKYNIPFAVCGHTHFKRELKIENTTVICRPLGYFHEWKNILNSEAELLETFYVIDL